MAESRIVDISGIIEPFRESCNASRKGGDECHNPEIDKERGI